MMEEKKPQLLRRGSGHFRTQKVVKSKSYGEVLVREFASAKNADGAPVLEGFPTISLASILSAAYIREQLKLPLIGVMSCPHFPPRCIIENGTPSHAIRIFGDKRLVVIVCEFKLPNDEIVANVGQAVLDFVKRHSSPFLFAVDGYPSPSFGDEEAKLRFVSTAKIFSVAMLEEKLEPLEDAVISGVTGYLLAEGEMTNEKTCCLLAPAAPTIPDANGAVTVVQILTKFLDLDIDLGPLKESAKKLHQSISALVQTSGKSKVLNEIYS